MNILQRRLCEASLLFGFSLLVTTAHGGLILQDQGRSAGIMVPPDFKGQSFIAEDPLILSIGIGVRVLNAHIPSPDTSITMSLYAGAGNVGPLLGTRTVDPGAGGPLNSTHWVDFAFTSLVLNPGSTYTFTYTSPTPYWGGQYNQHSLANGTPYEGGDYTGGHMFIPEGFRPLLDTRFRIVPVPEPGPPWIAAAGGLLLWLVHLTRKQRS